MNICIFCAALSCCLLLPQLSNCQQTSPDYLYILGNFVLGPPIHVTLEVPSLGQQQQQQQQQQSIHYHHQQQHQQPSSQGGSLQQIGNNYQGARIAGVSSQMAQSRIIQSQQSVPTQQMQQLNLTEGGGRQPSNSAYPPPPPFTLRV